MMDPMRGMGVMPTYEDIWGEPTPEVSAIFSRLPLTTWLQKLSYLAIALSQGWKKADEDRFLLSLFEPAPQGRILQRLRSVPEAAVMDLYSVLMAMQFAAALSPATLSACEDHTAETALQGVYTVSAHLTMQLDAHIPTEAIGSLAAIAARSSLGSVLVLLARAYGCWLWPHAYSHRVDTERSWFEQFHRAATELGLSEWVAGLTLLSFMFQQQRPETILQSSQTLGFPIPGTEAGGPSILNFAGNNALRRIVQKLSTDSTSLAKECSQSLDELSSGSLRLIRMYPSVQSENDRYLVLSPVHLAEAALERPLFVVPNEHGSVRDKFGDILECYVHAVLRFHFGDRYEPLPPSPVRGQRRADGVIWYQAGCILVECKAKRMLEKPRYAPRTDDQVLQQLLRSGLESAVDQLQATVPDALSGRLPGGPIGHLKVIGSLIVFWDEIPQHPLAGKLLEQVLPQTRTENDVRILRPHVLSLTALEDLGLWAHLNLLEVLSEKMSRPETSFESLRNFLLYTNRPGTSPDRLRQSMIERITALYEPWLRKEATPMKNKTKASDTILELRFWNFRALRWAVLPLSDLTVLVGENGSGKSTVAQALNVISQALTEGLETALIRADGAAVLKSRTVDDEDRMGLAVRFRHGGEDWVYGFVLRFRGSVRLPELGSSASAEDYLIDEEGLHPQGASSAIGFHRNYGGEVKEFSSGKLGTSLPDTAPSALAFPLLAGGRAEWKNIWRFLQSMRSFHIVPEEMRKIRPAGSASAPLYEDGSNAADVLHNLKGSLTHEWICEHLARTTAGVEDAFAITSLNARILSMRQKTDAGPQTFTGHGLSDGTLRMLGALLALRQEPRPSLVFLDEMESDLHPPVLGILIGAIAACLDKTQVIVSTHSVEALSDETITADRLRILHWSGGTSTIHRVHPTVRALLKPPENAGRLLSIGALEPATEACALNGNGYLDRQVKFLGLL